jgi:uncharacterized protein YdbL (DUF1318 family)
LKDPVKFDMYKRLSSKRRVIRAQEGILVQGAIGRWARRIFVICQCGIYAAG